MNRNKKLIQMMAIAMTGIMVANAGMGCVYAADEKINKDSTKEETVYVKASPSGDTQEIIVSDWLKNTNGDASLSDKTDLTDIKNVKGDETFTQEGDTITWDANGNDIYYQGTSTKDLPVSVKVTYYLDGKEISPDDLAGKSGHVKMVYQYTNHLKQGEIYTPFVLLTGMVLPGDNFSNVKVSNGKSISDGDKNIVIGVGLPGLQDSLKIKGSSVLDDMDIDLNIPDSFEVEADATDFNLSMSMTVASPLSLDDLELDQIDDTDDLKDKIDEIADAATQLVDGTSDLADGVQELKDGCTDLIDGIDQLDDGAGELNDGIQTLNSKKGDLIDGIKQLSDGLDQLNSKKGALVSGVNQLADGASSLDSGAVALKTGMDQLAAGINSLDANRPALMSGLQQLMNGVGQMENNKEALTGGAAALAAGVQNVYDNLVKLAAGSGAVTLGLESLRAGTESGFAALVNGLEALSQGLKASIAEDGDVTVLTAGIEKYVATANALIGGQSSTEKQTKAEETSAGSEDVNVSVDVSFAESNPEAIASLQSAIAGNEAVLESLKDVQSKESSVPDKLLKEYSGAYNTYTGQLSNCIAQLEADIANQKAALAAMQQTQTVNTTQKVELQNETKTAGTESGTESGNADALAQFKASGEQLVAGSKKLQTTLTGLSEKVDQLLAGAKTLQAVFYGTGDQTAAQSGEQANVLGQLYAGSKQVSDGTTALEGAVKDQLLTGANTLSGGVNALYDGIDALYVGFNTLSLKLPTLDKGIQSLAGGASQLQTGVNSLKEGTGTLSAGTKTLQSGANTLSDGVQQLANGGKQLKAGGNTLSDGIQQLADGSSQLKDGTSQLKDGSADLDSGVDELLDGANELRDGMEEFDEEAIQKLVDFADEDIQDMLDRLKDIRDAGDAYQFFTDGEKDSVGNVKFIIETASIGDEE